MPIQTSFFEHAVLLHLKQYKAMPTPILDLAGLFAFQAVTLAVQQGLLQALAELPLTPAWLAQQLNGHERGLRFC